MNPEQVKSGVRWFISTFGGFLVGWAASRGWVNAEMLTNILSSETFIGLVTAGAMLVWGIFNKTKANMVASTMAIPEVKGVITTQTVAGAELAKAVPDVSVVAAGTAAAAEVARP